MNHLLKDERMWVLTAIVMVAALVFRFAKGRTALVSATLLFLTTVAYSVQVSARVFYNFDTGAISETAFLAMQNIMFQACNIMLLAFALVVGIYTYRRREGRPLPESRFLKTLGIIVIGGPITQHFCIHLFITNPSWIDTVLF